ncbi:hypothetical protein [Plantactinospora endophytica]|uniref:Uncharacterized protein n=1 Tax=Plantactinospora endophytica TaxID=673535 RepID=A0ABQ4EAC3_9ACTN|nr:hypothetical protein [Plantactinospora endophytica]GIG91675.1 hypothetical protein Pen02_66110 [Plantactinospora endophytica]
MRQDGSEDWAEQRRQAIAARALAEQRRREAEHEQARELVAAFTAQARERGLRQTRLRALAYNGRSRYRTRLTGWYLDLARVHAVDAAGNFYLLTVPTSLRARLTGATPAPQPPKLVVGEGGPDGQSIPLAALLRKRLDAGDRWPEPAASPSGGPP